MRNFKQLNLQVLKAKIKGLELESQGLRKLIHKNHGLDRWAAWNRKRDLGEWTRYHLVAYGLLRGVPYEKIERVIRNELNLDSLLRIIKENIPHWSMEQSEWTYERVKRLTTRVRVKVAA